MKKHTISTFNRVLLTVGFFLMGLVFAQAQNVFIGAADNQLWSDPANWLNGEKPNEDCSEVIIRADVIVDEDATIPTLADAVPCNLTIQEGKKLTVTVGIVWDDGGDFILEDGAQLVNNDPIQATVLKKIAAQDSENSYWNLIASPVMEDVVPSLENGFLIEPETGYALYTYNAANHHWDSYKDSPFNITNGYSYLYANALDTTLFFTGTLRGTQSATEIDLSYYPGNGIRSGCNYLGNPLPCDAFVSKSYYVFYENSNTLKSVALSSQTPVQICQGLLVEANAVGDKVSFVANNNPEPPQTNNGYIEITAAKSSAPTEILDQIQLSYNPDDDLRKYFFENTLKIYFTYSSKDYAILSIDSLDALPLKFKAVENDTYTLHFEFKELELSYLHLIDNLLGLNVDLLATPNYTFDATSDDYASRFRLVFDPHFSVEEYEYQEFAYYSNGEIHLVSDAGDATLQVIDMTGRIVLSDGGHTRCVPTSGIPAGVYVLRLNTQQGVRVQKIVID